ncbi:MAG: hypothetical protein J2P50_19800, partial [Hyphomicrobiaceae bacterium]|nr:hypothetical protein [Hyphomicrobiaceae bacterium]
CGRGGAVRRPPIPINRWPTWIRMGGRLPPDYALEGFAVEFRGAGAIVDELMFHQPNGTFIARRVDG